MDNDSVGRYNQFCLFSQTFVFVICELSDFCGVLVCTCMSPLLSWYAATTLIDLVVLFSRIEVCTCCLVQPTK